MVPIRWAYLWLVLSWLLYPSSRACAQTAESSETAQDWFQRGVSLSRAAQWSDARAAYLRSLDLEPRVSTYFNLATASLKLRLGRATLLALDDFAPLADPRVHAEFLAEAARMRAEALELTGTVVLTGLGGIDATVEVDQEAPRWPLSPEHQLSLDPGRHVLQLRAPSHLTSSIEVDVARGTSTRLSPTLQKVPAEEEAPVQVSAPPAAADDNSSHAVWLWGGVAAVGLGALAAVLVLTLRSEPDMPPAAGGSLNMVFD